YRFSRSSGLWVLVGLRSGQGWQGRQDRLSGLALVLGTFDNDGNSPPIPSITSFCNPRHLARAIRALRRTISDLAFSAESISICRMRVSPYPMARMIFR